MPRRVLNLTQLGWGLAIPVLILSALGITSIHATDRSTTAVVEVDQPGRGTPADTNWLDAAVKAIGPMTWRQGLYLVTGIGLLFVVLVPSYRRVGRYAYLFYGVIVLLLFLLFLDRYLDLPLIPVRRDVRRWIDLGAFSIQPSEFMKVGLILALAYYLRYRKSYRTWAGLIPPFLLTLGPMVLILRQPDLGTLLMLLPVT